MDSRYDTNQKMLTQRIYGYNYHPDADSGVMHNVRNSFSYEVSLLNLDEKKSTRAL